MLWLVPVAVLVVVLGSANVFTQEAVLFSKTAVITFGGAYAVLGYVAQQAVQRYAWISPQDMIAGLGLAETTPGPLIMVVEFVGFLAAYNNPGSLPPLLAGMLGAVLTVWVTFVPCFLFIFLGAPYVERLRGNGALAHALTAVGAAVAGVVLNLAVWFAIHTAFATSDERRHRAAAHPGAGLVIDQGRLSGDLRRRWRRRVPVQGGHSASARWLCGARGRGGAPRMDLMQTGAQPTAQRCH